MKYKIDKVKLNNNGNWKEFNDLRNEKGVKEVLRNAGNEIGETVATYKGLTRAHAIIKVDNATYNNLVAQGVIIPRPEESEENGQ